jgi:probable blue pigment (indigoidine) exporter
MVAAFVVPWKMATPHGDESSAVLILLTSAAILNSILLLFTRRTGRRVSSAALKLTAILAVLTLVGNFASAAAIERISAPLLSVMQRSEVLVVALMAWVVLRERPHALFWAGAAVAAAGFGYMQQGEGGLDTLGLVYGVSSAVAFGSMTVAVRHYIQGIDAVFVNALRLWASVGLWLVVQGGLPDAESFNSTQIFYVAIAALAGPFLGRLCTMQSSRYLEARFTSLILLSAPVLTVPIAWVFIGTIPTNRVLVGSAVMMAGIAIPVSRMLHERRRAG